jgi:hypothetical protein
MKTYEKRELEKIIPLVTVPSNYPEDLDGLLGEQNADTVREMYIEKNLRDAYLAGTATNDEKLLKKTRKVMVKEDPSLAYRIGARDRDVWPNDLVSAPDKELMDMSRAPFVMKDPEEAYRTGHNRFTVNDEGLVELSRAPYAKSNPIDAYEQGKKYKDAALIELAREQMLLQGQPEEVYRFAFRNEDRMLMENALEKKLKSKGD